MVNTTPKERAKHILQAKKLIKEFVGGIDEVAFSNNFKIQSAVQCQFLILPYTVKHCYKGV